MGGFGIAREQVSKWAVRSEEKFLKRERKGRETLFDDYYDLINKTRKTKERRRKENE